MKHVKKVTVSKAQFFDNGNFLDQPLQFWAWLGSIVYAIKEFEAF